MPLPSFSTFPWRNRRESLDTPLSAEDLQSAERRLADYAVVLAEAVQAAAQAASDPLGSAETARAAAQAASDAFGEAAAVQAAIEGTFVRTSSVGAANGVASLDGGGKVPVGQLPAFSTGETFVVASQAAQLALVGVKKGDAAVRTDIKRTFLNKTGENTSIAADWIELLPGTTVEVVNGKGGPVITLTAADVGADKAGAATSAQTAAVASATTKVTAEENRAKAAEKLARENAETAAKSAAAAEVTTEKNRAVAAEATKLAAASNLSDVASSSSARSNLGLGTAATHATTEYARAHLLEDLGNVTGTVSVGFTAKDTVAMTAVGNVTIPKPTAWPEGVAEVLLILKQDATGGHTFTLEGVNWVTHQAVLDSEPNAVNFVPLISSDGGATIYAVNTVEGQPGVAGPKGLTGPAGATGPTGSQGPPGATGAAEALGEVEGSRTLDLSKALGWTMTAKGNLEIKFTNWPQGLSEPELYITQDSVGAHTITIPGVTWENEEPVFDTSANAVNIIPLSSPDGGAHVFGIRGQRGEKGTTGATGEKGTTGATGPAGAAGLGSLTKLVLPFASGHARVSASTAVGTQFKAYFTMAICELPGELTGLYYYNGAVVKGKHRVAVFDTGQKTSGKYFMLGQSAAITQENVEKVKLATLETPVVVTAGAVLMFAIMSDDAAATFGFQGESLNQNYVGLPTSVSVAGISASMNTVPVTGVKTFAELKFETINKETIEINAKAVALMGHVV